MINRLWRKLWGSDQQTDCAQERIALIRCATDHYFDCRHKHLPKAFDFTCVGGALHFVNDTAWRESTFSQILTLIEWGINIRSIFLVDHFDPTGQAGCNAYQDDDSRDRHECNLRQGYRLIKDKADFIDIQVYLYLHDINGEHTFEVMPVAAMEAFPA